MGLVRPEAIMGIIKTGFQDYDPPTFSLVAPPFSQLHVFQVGFVFQMCLMLFYPEKMTLEWTPKTVSQVGSGGLSLGA